jgi:hypothetical protein
LSRGSTSIRTELLEVIGSRGESIVELCLTDYQTFARPLFRPGFLGDKWPSIDFYVELQTVRGKRPYFFAQAKATASNIRASITISAKRQDIERLLRIPGPTYILGVHEPSKRVFVRSVHEGAPLRAMTRIPISHELTSRNLRILHDEVRDYWAGNNHKPRSSVFA